MKGEFENIGLSLNSKEIVISNVFSNQFHYYESFTIQNNGNCTAFWKIEDRINEQVEIKWDFNRGFVSGKCSSVVSFDIKPLVPGDLRIPLKIYFGSTSESNNENFETFEIYVENALPFPIELRESRSPLIHFPQECFINDLESLHWSPKKSENLTAENSNRLETKVDESQIRFDREGQQEMKEE